MSAVCTIRAEFVGIPLGPCGQPAEVVSEGRRPVGHVRRRPICAHHADAFALLPQQVFCEQCDEAGVESPVTVTITNGAEQ